MKNKYTALLISICFIVLIFGLGAYEDTSRINIYDFVDGDYGDWSVSSSSATLDADVVGPNELADGDYGDVLMSSGAITVDPNATPTVAGLTVQGISQAYYISEAVKTDNYTITTADLGKSLRMNSSSDKTFSLPSVADANDGGTVTLEKMGSGRLTIDAADSDYIHNSGAGDGIYNDDNSTYASITLRYCHADVRWYIVSGNGAWVTYD